MLQATLIPLYHHGEEIKPQNLQEIKGTEVVLHPTGCTFWQEGADENTVMALRDCTITMGGFSTTRNEISLWVDGTEESITKISFRRIYYKQRWHIIIKEAADERA
jgi:hypothetical protein